MQYWTPSFAVLLKIFPSFKSVLVIAVGGMDFISRSTEKSLDGSERNTLLVDVVLHPVEKNLVNFVVLQLYIDSHRKKHQIIKFDFSHKYYNIHKYYLGHARRLELSHKFPSNELLHEAIVNVKANWHYYRDEYLRRFLPAELSHNNRHLNI